VRISFHGAAREVTGSCHLIECGGRRILLDCGLIQGGSERHERNREPFPFDPKSIDLVVLSHAHIDHSGRLPLLAKSGYSGPILATSPTVALCEILLTDSGRIHEEDARWKIKRLGKKGEDANWVRPLYTEDDARAVLGQFVAVPMDGEHELEGVGTVRFVRAGHILGAAIVQLELREGAQSYRVTFSGDLGVPDARLVGGPSRVDRPDYLLMESTYGDRSRVAVSDKSQQLLSIIERTVARGGKLIIPSFAVGRTQAVLARINDLVESGRLDRLPVYVDSPMAIHATRVFASHPEAYSREAREKMRCGDEPLEFPGLELTATVEESKEINRSDDPCIVISASGMATAGRIKHHLTHNISDPRSTVLFVGYQAHGTLGRVIQQGTDPVRIFGEWLPVRAEIATIEGFSAHADRDELLGWFDAIGGLPLRTFVVHGEEPVAVHFASTLEERFGASAVAPKLGESFEL
jgi:metallo-beta-lactamase family protein